MTSRSSLVHQCPSSSHKNLGDVVGDDVNVALARQRPPLAHGRHKDGGWARLARHRVRRARLSGRRTIDVVSKRAATTAGTPTLFTSSGGRAEHKRRVFPQTTALPRFPCHRSLQWTLCTDRGEVWATKGYPQSMTDTTTSAYRTLIEAEAPCSEQISIHFYRYAPEKTGHS